MGIVGWGRHRLGGRGWVIMERGGRGGESSTYILIIGNVELVKGRPEAFSVFGETATGQLELPG